MHSALNILLYDVYVISPYPNAEYSIIYSAVTFCCKTPVWFGLVYLFIHSVTYVTLDTSITDYNLQHNL
jgi:hypothetical protein